MKKIVLYAAAIFLIGLFLLALWLVVELIGHLSFFPDAWRPVVHGTILPWLNRWSKVLTLIGFSALILDLFMIRLFWGKKAELRITPLESKKIVVGMTAYNDELSIGGAVQDFLGHPLVSEVIVIDNNCIDRTAAAAEEAGAVVVKEEKQGYGYACIRALEEAAKRGEILALVEGDQTFSANDLNKMAAYIENADLVLGTRTTRELASPDSQLDVLMNLGNQLVAKLIQLRFWGVRFSDVGCTYRLMTKTAYERFRGNLSVGGMHFAPHMIIEAGKAGLKIIEIPVTFRKRVGESKGVGGRKLRGLWVAFKMLRMIYFS